MEKSTIKFIKSLGDKKGRDQAQLFVCEGIKLVSDIISSQLEIERIYFTKNCEKGQISQKKGLVWELISESEMERISQLKSHTPLLALVKIPSQNHLPFPKNELVLALDGVQDPGNMGTIIRLADWFGITKIYCSFQSVDIYNPKVVQATMGAIAKVEVFYTNLPHFLSQLKEQKTPLYTTALEGENIYNTKLEKNGVLIMGNEGKGVSEEILRLSDNKLFIPPYGEKCGSESLNVSIATAIACSEFRRRTI